MKQVLFLFIITFSSFVFATGENKVYIEQTGSSNLITIDQIGASNNLGGITQTNSLVYGTDNIITTFDPAVPSATNYATVNGSTNTLSILQKGDSNWMQYNIQGNNNSYTNSVTGDSNKVKLTVGAVGSAKNANTISEIITGDLNFLIQNLTKNGINTSTEITGSSNQLSSELNSATASVTTTVTGNSNSLINKQDDGGSGHILVQSVIGDYNSIVTQQQGTNDSTINIATTGNNNTITVRSTNASAIVNEMTAVAR